MLIIIIIIATIQNNDEYCPEYSPEHPQRYCLLKQYAEGITLKLNPNKQQQMGIMTWM